ncbi:hypothetical protein Tco_0227779 [Tanacetum coccineum]
MTISESEESVRKKDFEIKNCLERLNNCENKLHKVGQTRQTIHMIMPSKDKMYNGRKGIGFENPSYFCKEKELRPSLYNGRVIGLGYTLMFLTHSDEALEIGKFKRARENKIAFAYDYGNLNEMQVKKLKSENDGLKLSVEELTKACETLEATFRQRDEMVSGLRNYDC